MASLKRDTPRSVGLRASRNLVLRFGLVNVPIGTAPALDASARVSGTLRTTDGETVKQVYRTEAGKILERKDLVTTYEASDGSIVTLTDAEKAGLESTRESDGGVTLIANVESSEVPVEWITGTNLAWPQATVNDEAYMLVCAYLRSTGRVFLGRFVERGTTKVLAVRWSDVYGCLVVQTLAYAAQVRDRSVELVQEGLARMAEPTAEMLSMAGTLFGQIADDFAWDEVRDEMGERMVEAIEEKAASGEVTIAPNVAPAAGEVPDLLAALKASIEGVAA